MDYARFNYVAQPGDKGVKLTPPDLGPYDDYVIKYAYTPLPDKKDMFDEEKTIRGWIDEKVGDPIYRYGRQQVIARYDPTAIEEDLGDDHIKAGDYGIGNLKYVLSHMEEWITDEEDPDLKIRTELYEAAAGQFARYVNAVMLNVGGIYLTDVNSNTAGGPQAVSVPKELQRASLKWVLAQMKDSAWLEQPALTEKLPLHVDLSFILRFNFCRAFFTYYKNVTLSSHIADDPYTPQEYMDDLYNIVFESTIKGGPVSPSERLIQRMFVDAAADVASSEAKRMKLGGIAEAYAPSVDEIALMGLDRSGIVERYLGPLREAEEEHGKGIRRLAALEQRRPVVGLRLAVQRAAAVDRRVARAVRQRQRPNPETVAFAREKRYGRDPRPLPGHDLRTRTQPVPVTEELKPEQTGRGGWSA